MAILWFLPWMTWRGGVDIEGFDNGFYEGIDSIMAVENPEKILVSTMRIQPHTGIIRELTLL